MGVLNTPFHKEMKIFNLVKNRVKILKDCILGINHRARLLFFILLAASHHSSWNYSQMLLFCLFSLGDLTILETALGVVQTSPLAAGQCSVLYNNACHFLFLSFLAYSRNTQDIYLLREAIKIRVRVRGWN